MKNKKALVLYSRVMPYTIEAFKALIKETALEIHLVHYAISKNAPYQLPAVDGLITYDEDSMSLSQIKGLLATNDFKFLFISGWSNKKYLEISKKAKKNNVPVISGCDTQWRGDFRQIIAVVFSKFLIRKYFDFLMVPGTKQYEYGRLLGFKKHSILMPLYTADVSLFSEGYHSSFRAKQNKYPRNILFVGRFEKVKGINLLLDAFNSIKDKKGWTLTLIGNGSLKNDIIEQTNSDNSIIIKGFLQPEELVKEISNAGAFCLPSNYEPWGVVLQEFATAGLPIIASSTCGANVSFVRENYNGYTFKNKKASDLQLKIEKLISLDDTELQLFSKRSHGLGNSITSEQFASNFFQFLE